jgi:5-methylcytosine-specific restriction endonuclease McrA
MSTKPLVVEIGQRFTRLVVLERDTSRPNASHRMWKCHCDCGATKSASSSNLTHGKIKSCGCLRHEKRPNSPRKYSPPVPGQQFGRLTVVRMADPVLQKGRSWERTVVRCTCGLEWEVYALNLHRGLTTSCDSCNRVAWHSQRRAHEVGQRYGRLTIIAAAETRTYANTKQKTARWLCQCDCGAQTVVYQRSLREGITSSCGCYQRERAKEANLVDGRYDTPGRDATRSVREERKKKGFVEHIDRLVVYERDKGICHICGEPIAGQKWETDHKIPLAKGGKHSYDNVGLAHRTCNRKKWVHLRTDLPASPPTP